MHADRARAQRFSITRADELQLIEQVARPADDAPWHERAKHFVMENKYSVLGYTWLGTVGVSLAYNFSRRDIAVPQKLINSRMIAQAMVLAGFAGMALIASAAPKPVKIDPHFERVVNQAPAKDTH
nr:hypothetical protein HK105_007040 [Polyrhizophydium stewartii]